MKVVIKAEGERFVVDPVDKSGSPAVGRGASMVEALGDFVICYQTELGLDIVVDESAQAAENQRRADALAQR